MWKFDHLPVPAIRSPLPGPKAKELLDRDGRYVSPSYTRVYPLVVARGSGAVIEDVDGNRFLDLTAGIAVTAAGHCHPEVVEAIQDQAEKLLHMSGTDFYYKPQIDLAQRLAESAPGPSPKRVFFTNSGAEALEAALKLAPSTPAARGSSPSSEHFTGGRTGRCPSPGPSSCIVAGSRRWSRTSTTSRSREAAATRTSAWNPACPARSCATSRR